MTWSSSIRAACVASALLAASCVPHFDTDGKDACITDDDCLAGNVCLLGPGGRFGECIDPDAPPPRDAGADTLADVAPDTSGPCRDRDNDGVETGTACGGPVDCDDGNVTVFPGADELCNARDDDCDGTADEGIDLQSDPNQCGACGRRCEGDNASVACDEGRCVVTGCATGWRDANASGVDGCETACATSEAVCGDGLDDDCDGFDDTADTDCASVGELADHRYWMLAWDADPAPSIRVGTLAVDATGSTAALTGQLRTALERSGRGEPAADETWTFTTVTDTAVAVARGDTAWTMHRSAAAPGSVLTGVSTADGTYYLGIRTDADTPAPNVARDWLAWVVSPFNELATVPGGGSAALGWSDPVELALLRYGAAGTNGRGGVTWPFAEYRTRTEGDPTQSSSLRSMGYQVNADGTIALELYNGSPSDVERHFTGAVTPAGDLSAAVHRFAGAYCTRRLIDAGACVHDPIVSVAISPSPLVGIPAMRGQWRLVGIGYDEDNGAVAHALRDVAFSVDTTGTVRGEVSGSVGTFGSNDTFIPPTTRIDLRGDPVGGGTLVLEGHVASTGYGVFWDQSGETFSRPMNGGVYLLVRVGD